MIFVNKYNSVISITWDLTHTYLQNTICSDHMTSYVLANKTWRMEFTLSWVSWLETCFLKETGSEPIRDLNDQLFNAAVMKLALMQRLHLLTNCCSSTSITSLFTIRHWINDTQAIMSEQLVNQSHAASLRWCHGCEEQQTNWIHAGLSPIFFQQIFNRSFKWRAQMKTKPYCLIH